MILLSSSGYAQLITVFIIFVAVLGLTAGVSKWIANYQKSQFVGRNIEVVETTSIANGKWVQIIRVGNTYKVLGLSKDQITFLGDMSPEDIRETPSEGNGASFKSMFEKAIHKVTKSESVEPDADVETAEGDQ